MIFVYSPRGEVSRWARSNLSVNNTSLSVCSWINFFNNILSLTLKTQNHFCCLLSPRPRVISSSLLAARSPGETKVNPPERYDDISSITSSLLFCFILSISLSVCLMTKVLHSNSRKTSAVRSLHKEWQTYSNNEKPTSGRAFAVSVLLSCRSSDRSYPPVSLSVCLSFDSLSNLCFFSLCCLLTSSSLRLLYLPINSSFIHLENVMRHKHFCSFVHLCFLLSPLQQDLQVSKSDLGRDAKISRSLLFLSFFKLTLLEVYFCLHFCLQCSSSAVLFLSNPWFLFCPYFFFFIKLLIFLLLLKE